MKIQCEIIRDILPLYAEDMVSQPTREMVEEHLGECEGCEKELERLQADKLPEGPTQTNGLELVKKAIRKARILTAATAVLLLISFCLWLYGFMNVPVYLSQEEAVKEVYLADNGVVVVDYFDYVRGSCGRAQPGYTMAHICYTTRWDRLALEQGWVERVWDRKLVGGSTLWESRDGNDVIIQAEEDTSPEDLLDTGTDKSWWYIDYRSGEAEGILWDAGDEIPTGKMAVALYDLGIAAWIAVALGVIAQIAGNFIKGKKLRLVFWYAGALGNCYGISTFLLLGRNTICYNDCFETLNYISGLTLLLWITVVVIRKLRQLDKV